MRRELEQAWLEKMINDARTLKSSPVRVRHQLVDGVMNVMASLHDAYASGDEEQIRIYTKIALDYIPNAIDDLKCIYD